MDIERNSYEKDSLFLGGCGVVLRVVILDILIIKADFLSHRMPPILKRNIYEKDCHSSWRLRGCLKSCYSGYSACQNCFFLASRAPAQVSPCTLVILWLLARSAFGESGRSVL